jgi:hypothetical protein
MSILRTTVLAYSKYFDHAAYVMILIWLCALQTILIFAFQLLKGEIPLLSRIAAVDIAQLVVGARILQIY